MKKWSSTASTRVATLEHPKSRPLQRAVFFKVELPAMSGNLRYELARCKTEARAIRVIRYLVGGHLAKARALVAWKNAKAYRAKFLTTKLRGA